MLTQVKKKKKSQVRDQAGLRASPNYSFVLFLFVPVFWVFCFQSHFVAQADIGCVTHSPTSVSEVLGLKFATHLAPLMVLR